MSVGRRGWQVRGMLRRLVVVGAWAVACASILSCASDERVAPLIADGRASLELAVVDGPLARPGDAAGGCPIVQTGFPEDVVIEVTIASANASPIVEEIMVEAGSESAAIAVDGLAPGTGYDVLVEVRSAATDAVLFRGTRTEQTVRPGTREVISVELLPIGRRGVFGVGLAAPTADPDVVEVPVYLSHSMPLRGVQVGLCFDDAMLEVLDVEAIGRLAEVERLQYGRGGPAEPYRVVAASSAEHPLAPGQDAVFRLRVRFTPQVEPGARVPLTFVEAILAETPDPDQNFTVYFFDGSVTR